MPNISYTNTSVGLPESGSNQYLKARGSGTAGDPHIPIRDVADDPVTFTETQLTEPGTTTSRDARGYQYLSFYVTVTGINDSLTIVPEISPDNTLWAELQRPVTLVENGTVYITFDYTNTLGYVRLNWLSETGGSSATLDVITVIQ